MAEDPQPPFTLDRLAHVQAQIRELGRRAVKTGLAEELRRTLESIVQILLTKPLEWGDPLYHTKKPGGTVCHGFLDALHVHFVVYVPDRLVCILDVEPMPNSPLAKE